MNVRVATANSVIDDARAKGRVMLVTDHDSNSSLIAALEGAGFTLAGVSRSMAAVVSLPRTRPHLVIAACDLKGISALELARKLSISEDFIPCILVGAEPATDQRRQETLAAGAQDYFQLPQQLQLLLTRVGHLVALRQNIDRLRAEADLDPLTGLANRRRFRKALGNELERFRRYRTPCALILLDIDHLKKINDAHGHSVGDVMIRHVAATLAGASRDNDTAARLGGEEFALLLAGVNEKQGVTAAARLQPTLSAEPVQGYGLVTVSLGVAACPGHANSERALYAASDKALYRAKNEGRNRVVVAPAMGLAAPN
ncbi:MAG: diguanylate cyclase [Pyrinomonadaceae bacterium]